MPNYKVTFQGDLGNLRSWDASIRNTVQANSREIESANKRLLSQVGKLNGDLAGAGNKPGLYQTNLRTTIDGTNRSMRIQGDLVRQIVTGYEVAGKAGARFGRAITETQYVSPFKHYVADLDKYEDALKRIAPLEQRILTRRRNIVDKEAELQNLGQIKSTLQTQANQRTSLGLPVDPAIAAQLKAVDAAIAKTIGQLAKLEAAYKKFASSTRRTKPYQDLRAAISETPPIPKDLQTVLTKYPDLAKNLLRGGASGLGGGAALGSAQFQKNIADQEATISGFTKNLRTNVTTIQGSFKDLNSGILQKFTVDLDQNGKVLGRWGGQLSGAGNILRQTVRDFQKVIEWTVATTLVFGTLAAVVKQLSSINELNTLLTRLSITAQTSAQETQDLFTDLGKVAIQTATPLKELISVADDIALATREAGQTTDEWKGKIVDLTTAVGIFTNLTGVDTVQAADQLSAAFKQLGIAPQELITVLNKVTAVAGGQSQAIADIVKALSSVSEAAKAAGFSLDEQIASVQVLSQVTNKSADDIATSFKNLFGSVSSVGSAKILKEFGIEIRDASGGVRDFLDIYQDVADALDKGIIPQNRLPDVLRGLAGGPRRAPDAAALLSNLSKINEVVAKSFNASNEALIANAKVLDTNQAKITQFQNAIDIAVYEKFGAVVQDLLQTFIGFGTAAVTAINMLPTALISLGVQLGLVLTSMKVFGGLLKLMGVGGAVGGAISGLKGLAVALGLVAVAQQAANASASGLVGVNGAPLSSGGAAGQKGGLTRRGKFALGAAAVAGGAALAGAGLTGNLDASTIGTLLQSAGAITTFIPSLAPLGIGLLAAGTAMQFLGNNSKEATISQRDLSKEVYTLTQNLQTAQQDASNYAAAQKSAGEEIEKLRKNSKLSVDQQSQLSAATDKFVTSTLNLAKANREVSSTFSELLEKIPKLGSLYSGFINQVGTLTADSPDIQKLAEQLAREILINTGQAFIEGANIQIQKDFNASPNEAGSLATSFSKAGGRRTQDLGDLTSNPALLKDLFNPIFNYKIPKNDVNVGYITSALAQLNQLFIDKKIDLNQQQLDQITASVQQFTDSVSSVSADAAVIENRQARVQALGAIGALKGPTLANATLRTSLEKAINDALGASTLTKTTGGPDERGQITPLAKAAQTLKESLSRDNIDLKGTVLDNTQLTAVGETLLKLAGNYDILNQIGEDALHQGIIQSLSEAGATEEQLAELTKLWNVELLKTPDILTDITERLDDARNSASQNYADRSLQLLVSKNSGDFDKNAKGLAELTAQNKAAYASELNLIDAISQLNGDSYAELVNSLSKVTGEQYLATLSGDDLEKKQQDLGAELIENAIKAGVNADGIRHLESVVYDLIGAINSIPPYKKIVIDAQLNTTGGGAVGAAAAQAILRAKAENAAAKQIKDLIAKYQKLLRQGKGGNVGKLPSSSKSGGGGSKAYNQPGLLDIPDEILQSSDAQALIKQAVKNARHLQSLVPGETKANKSEIVELLNGTKRVLETRGIGEEYLRRALDELTGQIKKQNDLLTKADTIRRIRVGAGSFASIANVPVNSLSGVSVGGPNGPVNITLNLNGTVLTPAQFAQFADLIAASLKRQLAN